jgi:hypothetical protein
MESKVVGLEVIPGHPKYIRLPSLSRSLIHSILPRTCREMHTRPSVFSVTSKNPPVEGPPALSESRVLRKKFFSCTLKTPSNIRPCTSSYTYKKMYQTKSSPEPIIKKYYTPKTITTEKESSSKVYYCEVVTPKNFLKVKKRYFKEVKKTNITFQNSIDTQVNLHNIPEVQASMESSEYTVGSTKSLSML